MWPFSYFKRRRQAREMCARWESLVKGAALFGVMANSGRGVSPQLRRQAASALLQGYRLARALEFLGFRAGDMYRRAYKSGKSISKEALRDPDFMTFVCKPFIGKPITEAHLLYARGVR